MTALDAAPAAPDIHLDVPEVVEPMGRMASLDQIPPQGEGALRVLVGNTPVGLFRVGEEIVAWKDVCPHEAASVCRGSVTGTRLQSKVYEYTYGRHQEVLHCPWHGWEFDLLTGEHLAMGSGAKLRRYPIEVRDGEVFDASGKGVPLGRDLRIEAVRRSGRTLEIVLVAADGRRLPAWQPGAHLEIALPSGLVRHYSLCGDDRDRDRYRIAVLREEAGEGGSTELHALAAEGAALHVVALRNRFPLRYAQSYLFLAAGIGITPILAMVRAASRRHSTYRAVYIGREAPSMPLAEEFSQLPGTALISTAQEGRPDLDRLLAEQPPDTVVYACGPAGFLEDVERSAERRGDDLEVRSELFRPVEVAVPVGAPQPFDVTLAGTGTTLRVESDESLLEVLRRHGVERPSSCESGWCGSCETSVVDGVVLHHDTVLDDEEREAGDVMMACVSRADGTVTVQV